MDDLGFPTPKRGGRRAGSGRKPGTGRGATVKRVCVSIPLELLPRLRHAAYREGMSLSSWLAAAGQRLV